MPADSSLPLLTLNPFASRRITCVLRSRIDRGAVVERVAEPRPPISYDVTSSLFEVRDVLAALQPIQFRRLRRPEAVAGQRVHRQCRAATVQSIPSRSAVFVYESSRSGGRVYRQPPKPHGVPLSRVFPSSP